MAKKTKVKAHKKISKTGKSVNVKSYLRNVPEKKRMTKRQEIMVKSIIGSDPNYLLIDVPEEMQENIISIIKSDYKYDIIDEEEVIQSIVYAMQTIEVNEMSTKEYIRSILKETDLPKYLEKQDLLIKRGRR